MFHSTLLTHKLRRCLPDFENLHTPGLSHPVPNTNKTNYTEVFNYFCICMPTYDFLVQAAQEHISKHQGQQSQSSVRTDHESQLLLLCIFTEMRQNFQSEVLHHRGF